MQTKVAEKVYKKNELSEAKHPLYKNYRTNLGNYPFINKYIEENKILHPAKAGFRIHENRL
jgi:hypothetical protein